MLSQEPTLSTDISTNPTEPVNSEILSHYCGLFFYVESNIIICHSHHLYLQISNQSAAHRIEESESFHNKGYIDD